MKYRRFSPFLEIRHRGIRLLWLHASLYVSLLFANAIERLVATFLLFYITDVFLAIWRPLGI